MEIEIKAFGIARDILGNSTLNLDISEETSVEKLMLQLKKKFPAFKELTSLAIAINTSYATPGQVIKQGDEVVIIPPVAGG